VVERREGAALERGVRISGVDKRFGAIHALRSVDLSLTRREIHAVVGQNGAGKSTLIRILTGALPPDSGRIEVEGRPVHFRSPADAKAAGIAVVHQDPQLFPDLSVADNVLAASPATRGRGPLRVRDRRRSRARAGALLAELGIELNLDAPAGRLVPTEWKLIEVARALAAEAVVLVLDEPTASLDPDGSARLLDLLRRLRDRGLAILFVSHKLKEVLTLSDRVTALREGAVTAHRVTRELDVEELVRLVAGERAVAQHKRGTHGEEVLLAAEGLAADGLGASDLSVHAGEIVALTGLLGSGAATFGRALAGSASHEAGCVRVRGHAIRAGRRADAAARGIGLVPEDRRGDGVVPDLSVELNIALGSIEAVSRPWAVSRRRVRAQAERYIEALSIRPADPSTPVRNLSGGNQQKVLVARWLATRACALVTEEPTHGLDIGAKLDIGTLLRRFASDGGCVVVVSLDIAEYIDLPDRIAVFRDGELVSVLPGDAGERAVTEAAVGAGGRAA
jgi:ABC-type sugar transport system ATPase subunit